MISVKNYWLHYTVSRTVNQAEYVKLYIRGKETPIKLTFYPNKCKEMGYSSSSGTYSEGRSSVIMV